MAAEKVGIEIELMGGQEAFNLLKRIDNQIDTLNKKKKFKSLGGLNSAKSELEEYINSLKKLNKEQEKWENLAKKVGKENMSAYGVREWERVKEKIKETQNQIKKMGSDMDSVTQKVRTFAQTFNSASSRIAHVGSAMQSLGNALTRLTSPFRRLTTGLLMGAGYKALNLFTEGFSNAFERADTMRNFDRSLEALGLDTKKTFTLMSDEALTAKENLDLAVQGLPTSLDEIMAAQKVYAGATGEMVDSTKTAIAANNAFLASTTDSRQQRLLQRYFVALASGANLTATQWAAMRRNMPLAFRKVGEAMGYMDMNKFEKDLSGSNKAGQEFLKTFQELGTTGVIRDAAMVMTKSWSGLFSNIRIATTRMGEGIIKTLNETFEKSTGRDLLSHLLGIDANGARTNDGIRDWINSISESVQKWISSHPEEIISFFNDLKNIDWKGLLKGVGEGMMEIANLIRMFAKWASDKDMSKIGKWATRLNILGWGLSTLGGVIKGLRHPLAALYTLVNFGMGGRLGKLGIFGKLKQMLGKTKDIKAAGDAGSAITTASPKLVSAFKNMALLSGIVAMPAVTGFVVTGAVKQTVKNFKDIIDLLKDMDWEAAAKVAAGIGAFIGGSAILGGVVGKFGVTAGTFAIIGETIVGLIATIGTGFADINMALIKGSIKKFVDSINLLKTIPDVSTFGDVKTKISNAITMMNEISSLLNGEWAGPGMHEGGVSNIGLGAVWGINTLAKALAPMKTAVQRINEIASMSISEGAVDNIRNIIKAISDIQAEMWRLMGLGFGNIKNNMKKVADAMYEMRRIVYHVNKLSGEKISEGGLKNITASIKAIGNAFDGNAIAEVRVKITGFVAAINDALTMFDKIKDVKINAKVTLSRNFYTSVDKVVKDIDTARKNIRNAWNGIPTSYSKTITFTLKARVVAENLYAGASRARSIAEDALNSVRRANGGLIYRAKGGGVPWKRRGTDTVPAMLTPGEYVHNRRAVSTFGIDFMRKVNNLDVKGAMNELMHRAGNMANVNRGTTINNYNNNQKVVINNNGNPGAGFTFKSASRFVGAI